MYIEVYNLLICLVLCYISVILLQRNLDTIITIIHHSTIFILVSEKNRCRWESNSTYKLNPKPKIR